MADIIKILNGEAGFSVRDKLNEVIDKVNASAVVVPVGDAPVFDPAKAGGYQAGSIISYRNEASPDAQFQTFAIYVANSDIPVGVSPEDSAEWLFKGAEYTIEGGNTSKNYVSTITALRSVSDMKNGDTIIVGNESRIYEFVEGSELGIKPFQAGVGSWMSRKRVSLSNVSRIYTSLDAMEGEEIPLPVGNVVISFADSCVFTITDGNGDAQLPVSLSAPSIVTKVGAGFLPSDIEIEPIGGGGHTILDPSENTMPTQPALQFGAGFTVTDEEGKTVVKAKGASTWEQDAAAIRALELHEDGMDVGNYATNVIYEYDAAASAADDGDVCLKPNDVLAGDPGRWVKQKTFSINGHGHTASQVLMSDSKTVEQAVNETRSQHVPFSVDIPFTSIMTSMPITASNEERIFAPITATAVAGARCMVVMTANGNGLHVPGFSSTFKTAPDSMGWKNINGSRNAIEFWYDGTDYWYKIIREESNLAYKSEVITKGGASGPFTPVHDDDPAPKKWTEDTIRQVVANYYPGLPSPDGLDLGWYGVEWDEGRLNPGCLRIGSLSGYAGGGAYGQNGYNVDTRPLSNVPEHLLFVHNKIKSVMLLDNGTESYDLDPVNNYNKSGAAPSIMDVITANGRTALHCTGLFTAVADDYIGRYAHNTTSGKTNRYALITGKTNNDTLVISDPRTGSPSTDIFEVGDTFEICTARFDGVDGQVMVKIPKFYFFQTYEPSPTGISGRSKVRIGVSMYPYDGFSVHPAFVDGTGSQVDAIYVSRLEAINVGGTLASLPDAIPANSTNFPTFRAQAQNRGAGWQLEMFWYRSALQLLFYTEYADLFSQHRLQAFTEGSGSQLWRRKGGRTLYAGNQSVTVVADDWFDADIINEAGWKEHKTVAMSYRGIENFYGHLWTCVDGINVNERNVYVTNNKAVLASDTPTGYDDLGVSLPPSTFFRTIHPVAGAIVPATSGASTVTHYTDQVYSNVGWRVCFAGGDLSIGANAGVAALLANNDSANVSWNIGARLCY